MHCFRCYPINSALADPIDLDSKLRLLSTTKKKHKRCVDDVGSDSSSSSSDSDDSSDSDSDSV